MPRTKAVKKSAILTRAIEVEEKLINDQFEMYRYNILLKLSSHLIEARMAIPIEIADKTLEEVTRPPSPVLNAKSIQNILDDTNYGNVSKKNLTRSSSFNDEGYLTAETSNGTSGRKSRARGRNTTTSSKNTRASRSASARATKNQYKTPAGKQPPSTYGLITPKVGPNTPQVLLRRPKQGEVALSLQGSPLFTGAVVSESIANINIPLEDGRLLSIQPRSGLRESQIPNFDFNTKRQLEALRDNLNKVCALAEAKTSS